MQFRLSILCLLLYIVPASFLVYLVVLYVHNAMIGSLVSAAFVLYCCYVLYRGLLITKYRLDIMTDKNKYIVYYNNIPYDANLLSVKQFSFLITTIKLHCTISGSIHKYSNNSNSKIITLPIFMDSVPICTYKQLRVFLQWS